MVDPDRAGLTTKRGRRNSPARVASEHLAVGGRRGRGGRGHRRRRRRLPEARTRLLVVLARWRRSAPSQPVRRLPRPTRSPAPATRSQWVWSQPCSPSPLFRCGGAGARCASGPQPVRRRHRNLQRRPVRRVRARLRDLALPAAAARVAVLLAVVAGMATALLSVSVGSSDPRPAAAGRPGAGPNKHKKPAAVTERPKPVPARTCWRLAMNAFRPLTVSRPPCRSWP